MNTITNLKFSKCNDLQAETLFELVVIYLMTKCPVTFELITVQDGDLVTKRAVIQDEISVESSQVEVLIKLSVNTNGIGGGITTTLARDINDLTKIKLLNLIELAVDQSFVDFN